MRLLMMATGPFAAPALESLLDSQHRIAALATRPAAASSGRRKAPPSRVRQIAQQHDVPLLEPENVNTDSARRLLADRKPDLLVVCDYGQILSDETLGAAPLGGVNLHASLLPRYRGAAPINWALYHGESETGVTVIHMTPQLDAGPRLTWRKTPIDPDETAEDLEPRLAQLGVAPLHEAIDMLGQWDGKSPIGSRQDPSLASKAPRLKKSDGQVNWSRSAEQIRNQVRAMKPWPGTFTLWRRGAGEPLRLILDRVSVRSERSPDAAPGVVVDCGSEQVWVAAGEGAVGLEKVQPAGKRVMDVAEFLRGRPMQPGDQLGNW